MISQNFPDPSPLGVKYLALNKAGTNGASKWKEADIDIYKSLTSLLMLHVT